MHSLEEHERGLPEPRAEGSGLVRLTEWLIQPASIRVSAWVAAGVSALWFVQEMSTMPAVVGLLGASGLGLAHLLRSRRRKHEAEPFGTAELELYLRDELDGTESWGIDLASGFVLSLPAVIFWNTAWAYWGTFGPETAIWWFVATLASLVPAVWSFVRVAGKLLRRGSLQYQLFGPDTDEADS